MCVGKPTTTELLPQPAECGLLKVRVIFIYVYMSMCLGMLEESVGPSGTEVIGSCEPPDESAGN